MGRLKVRGAGLSILKDAVVGRVHTAADLAKEAEAGAKALILAAIASSMLFLRYQSGSAYCGAAWSLDVTSAQAIVRLRWCPRIKKWRRRTRLYACSILDAKTALHHIWVELWSETKRGRHGTRTRNLGKGVSM
jgi:hypothetical protein